jgi:hypothetical protein
VVLEIPLEENGRVVKQLALHRLGDPTWWWCCPHFTVSFSVSICLFSMSGLIFIFYIPTLLSFLVLSVPVLQTLSGCQWLGIEEVIHYFIENKCTCLHHWMKGQSEKFAHSCTSLAQEGISLIVTLCIQKWRIKCKAIFETISRFSTYVYPKSEIWASVLEIILWIWLIRKCVNKFDDLPYKVFMPSSVVLNIQILAIWPKFHWKT